MSSLLFAIEGKLIHENFDMERKSASKKDDDQRVYCRGGYWLERCVTEPTDPAVKYQKTIRKAEELLKENYKTGNFLELNKCNKIVEHL